jgi:intracellular septation protein A
VVFGAIDLWLANPVMIKFESVIVNAVVGIFFVLGAFGEKPLLQELAERRPQGGSFPDRADVHRFFQLFTLFWAAYIFLRAGVFLWLAVHYPIPEAIAVRLAFGWASLGVMLAISFLGGRRLFFLCRWLGLLPKVEDGLAGPAAAPAGPVGR